MTLALRDEHPELLNDALSEKFLKFIYRSTTPLLTPQEITKDCSQAQLEELLIKAAKLNLTELVSHLILEKKININVELNAQTPLMVAARFGHLEMAKLLMMPKPFSY